MKKWFIIVLGISFIAFLKADVNRQQILFWQVLTTAQKEIFLTAYLIGQQDAILAIDNGQTTEASANFKMVSEIIQHHINSQNEKLLIEWMDIYFSDPKQKSLTFSDAIQFADEHVKSYCKMKNME